MDDRDKRLKIELPVFAAILAYLLLLLYETLQLRPDPRLVPLLVLIPGIAITVIHMINLVSPGLLPAPAAFVNLFGVDESEAELERDDPREGIRDSLMIVGWFALLVALTFLFGFIVATVAFAFLFLYTLGNQSAKRSVLVSVLLAVGLYLIFIELINIRPLEPLVPLGLP